MGEENALWAFDPPTPQPPTLWVGGGRGWVTKILLFS